MISGWFSISFLTSVRSRDHVRSTVSQSLKAPHRAALQSQMRFSWSLTVTIWLSEKGSNVLALSNTFVAHALP